MTEKQFIKQNKEKWIELERLLTKSDKDADRLQELFVKVSSDLSFARTFFPNRSVRLYLNNLTQQVFDKMATKDQKFGVAKIQRFFGHILPQEIYRSRYAFVVSFVVFALAVVVGAISTANNPEFASVILGEEYISMTEEFINEDDPMQVYKKSSQSDMFYAIAFNNIKVAFLAFVLGILGSIGSIFIIASNGIMVGAFQYFFHTKGLFLTSFLTIWIHGTIEISAIILAGAAGIILGNGMLFPKTFGRSTSLQISAVRALRVVMGTVPLFILASILESFVTRLTDLPMIVKILIILLSLIFILGMWVFYPWYYHKTQKQLDNEIDILPVHQDRKNFKKWEFRRMEDNFGLTLEQFKTHFSTYIKTVILPFGVLFGFLYWFYLVQYEASNRAMLDLEFFGYGQNGFGLFFLYWLSFALCLTCASFLFNKLTSLDLEFLAYTKQIFIPIALVSFCWVLPFYFIEQVWVVLLIHFILTPHMLVIIVLRLYENSNEGILTNISIGFKNSFNQYVHHFVPALFILFCSYLMTRLLGSGVGSVFIKLFEWHEVFNNTMAGNIFVNHWYYTLVFFLLFFVYFLYVANIYYSLLCKENAIDLRSRFKKFGRQSSIFELDEVLD